MIDPDVVDIPEFIRRALASKVHAQELTVPSAMCSVSANARVSTFCGAAISCDSTQSRRPCLTVVSASVAPSVSR